MLLPLFVLSYLAYASAEELLAPPGCTMITTTGYRYGQFYHGTIFDGVLILKFRVKARSDAHILLSTSPLTGSSLYEIVLGASSNNYIDVRRTMTGKSVSATKTPDVLSDKEFRGFWITYKLASGDLEVGTDADSLPLLHWKDPEPLAVHYFAFSSWTGIVAKWIHSCHTAPAKSTTGRNEGQETPAEEQLPYDYNVIEKLTGRLFSTYSKGIRPVLNHNQSVTVKVGLNMLFFDLDEHTSEFLVNAELRLVPCTLLVNNSNKSNKRNFSMEIALLGKTSFLLLKGHGIVEDCMQTVWQDNRLSWNASEYDELTVMHAPSDALWKPDLVLLNRADGNHLQECPESLAVFYSDGNVFLSCPAKLSALCSMDFSNWPFETHTCDLDFTTYTHNITQIGLALQSDPAIQMNDRYYGNRKWYVTSSRASLNTSDDPVLPQVRVIFSFTMRRSSPLFHATIITPSFGLIGVTLAMFLIPPNSGKKLTMGLTLMFLIAIYLITFLVIVPIMGDHSPVIVTFFAHTFVLVCFSVVLSALYLHLTRLPTISRPPACLVTLCSSRVGWALCLGSLIQFVTPSSNLASKKDGQPINLNEESDAENLPSVKFEGDTGLSRQVQMEWLLLACAVDRIFGIFYALLLVIYAASYL